jgi:hypothetical protein
MPAIHSERNRAYCRVPIASPVRRRLVNTYSPAFCHQASSKRQRLGGSARSIRIGLRARSFSDVPSLVRSRNRWEQYLRPPEGNKVGAPQLAVDCEVAGAFCRRTGGLSGDRRILMSCSRAPCLISASTRVRASALRRFARSSSSQPPRRDCGRPRCGRERRTPGNARLRD